MQMLCIKYIKIIYVRNTVTDEFNAIMPGWYIHIVVVIGGNIANQVAMKDHYVN